MLEHSVVRHGHPYGLVYRFAIFLRQRQVYFLSYCIYHGLAGKGEGRPQGLQGHRAVHALDISAEFVSIGENYFHDFYIWLFAILFSGVTSCWRAMAGR